MSAPIADMMSSELLEIASDAGWLNVATIPVRSVIAPDQIVLLFSFGLVSMMFLD